MIHVNVKNRYRAIDVMRGMTIAFMIIVNTPGSWTYVYKPLLHAEWHGCSPTDLVFPFFIFTVGMSLAFSMTSVEVAKSRLLIKILKRTAIIFIIGFLLNWFPFYHKHITDVRWMGVLQRIALSFGLAGLLVVLSRKTSHLLWVLGIGFVAYHLMQVYGGDFTLEGNVNNKIDQMIIPTANLYKGFGIPFDPEGLLGTIPSSMQVIIGFLTARYIRSQSMDIKRTAIHIMLVGIAMIMLSWLYCHIIPINKPLWTNAYVLHTSGKAMALLATLMYILDYLKVSRWAIPFEILGRNPLISFVLSILLVKVMLYVIKIDDTNAYNYLYKTVYQPIFGNYNGSLAFALSVLMLVYIFAFVLYRKNMIVKI